MTLNVEILVHENTWKTRLKPYTKIVRMACEAAFAEGTRSQGAGGREMTVVLADDDFIRQLNHTYRGKNKPTNVLSFVGEGEHLGDVVLALKTIENEARTQQKPLKNHAIHLLAHGVLHLLGHDHEEEKAAAAMEALEIKILKKLGLRNPYL